MTPHSKVKNSNPKPLSEIFPIAAFVGNEEENTLAFLEIKGVYRAMSYGDHKNYVIYTSTAKGGSSSYLVNAEMRDIFNILIEAHQQGNIADLTDETLKKTGQFKSHKKVEQP